MVKTRILCILDGFGLRFDNKGNPMTVAHLPTIKGLFKQYPWTTLHADGQSVGQEEGLVGNSEVGHMNLGGLQLVKQLSYQITQSSFQSFQNNHENPDQIANPVELLTQSFNQSDSSGRVHLVGLFSTGTIHSDMRHWIGALETAIKAGAKSIVIHIISDGRDSDRESLVETWNLFETRYRERLVHIQDRVVLGSIGGRFFAMDRDKNWERTIQGLTAMLNLNIYESRGLDEVEKLGILPEAMSHFRKEYSEQVISFDNIQEKLIEITHSSYGKSEFDETIQPQGFLKIKENDSVWFLNFRADRMKQLITLMCECNKNYDLHLRLLGMNDYGVGYEIITTSSDRKEKVYADNLQSLTGGYFPLFKSKPVENTLSQWISRHGKTQLHIAETEKYAHVTYFFDGGVEIKQNGEDWVIIPSNKVASHAEKPEMKAQEVTDYILENGLGKYDYIIVNYANPDMVGHTGDFDAARLSLEFLDSQLKRLLEAVENQGHLLILTADHGNIELVGQYDNSGKIDTEHNPNPVPLIIVSPENNEESISEKFTTFVLNNDLSFEDTISDSLISLEIRRELFIHNTWFTEDQIPKPSFPLWIAGIFLLTM